MVEGWASIRIRWLDCNVRTSILALRLHWSERTCYWKKKLRNDGLPNFDYLIKVYFSLYYCFLGLIWFDLRKKIVKTSFTLHYIMELLTYLNTAMSRLMRRMLATIKYMDMMAGVIHCPGTQSIWPGLPHGAKILKHLS